MFYQNNNNNNKNSIIMILIIIIIVIVVIEIRNCQTSIGNYLRLLYSGSGLGFRRALRPRLLPAVRTQSHLRSDRVWGLGSCRTQGAQYPLRNIP